MTSSAWREQAACKHVDTNVFFPGRGQNHRTNQARQICMACPVITQCRQEILDAGWEAWAQHGMWGGLSENERRRIRTGRPAPATRTYIDRTCQRCDTTYTPNNSTQRWCSTRCRDAARNERQKAS